VELFFPFPYKLKDPGTIWTSYSNTEKMPKNSLLKINFTSGTGDAPEDWYVVYADASTNLVQKSIHCYLKSKQRGSREESTRNI
jgi:hypothetical protein